MSHTPHDRLTHTARLLDANRRRKKARVQRPNLFDEAGELYVLTPARFEALADELEPPMAAIAA